MDPSEKDRLPVSTAEPNTAVEELLEFVKHGERSPQVQALIRQFEPADVRSIAFCVHSLLRRQHLYKHQKPATIKRSDFLRQQLPTALAAWPQLGELFALHDGEFNWRHDVPEETKVRLRQFAYEYYQPKVLATPRRPN
ncbi:hypothetical protein C5Y93_22650 [Blastopirellula marina]|uniref:Uncharacterized protein n=1 Tax=Blastopirellula marina TaxID=124 RepID=A0A2S8GGN2_9BACT|nr:hypothetical protein C5Y93_22650 [Blastopirellula marina]